MFMQQNGKQGYEFVRLAISGLSPLIMYFIIRPYVASDTEALALAWFLPVVLTLGSSLWQRRLDVFGLFGVVAYGITLAISIIFGAGALPLKLHHALVGGALGLVCLVSFAMGKPIFLLFIRRWMKNSTNKTTQAAQLEGVLADPLVVRRISILTLIVGIAALADAALQTVLAIVLSTSAFLIATTAVHIATIVGIVLTLLLLYLFKFKR